VISDKTGALIDLFLYTALFFMIWILRVAFLTPFLGDPDTVEGALVSTAVQAMIWVMPVFIYIKFADKRSPLTYLKLNRNIRKGVICGVCWSAVFAVYYLFLDFFFGDRQAGVNFSAGIWIWGIIFAGPIEEILFRGFILQKLNENAGFWVSNLITSLLFFLIHFPAWFFVNGMSPDIHNLFRMLPVLGLGFFWGYLFKRSGSLWAPVILHSVNNFLAFSIFSF